MTSEGMKAPNFELEDMLGETYNLKNFKSKYIVIFFYPKDNTPGCTIESVSFSENLKKFENLDTKIIGISGGDQKSKAKFCKNHNLKILMLSDTDFEVAKAYGVYGEKSFMGKKFYGINRVTFILNKKHNIIKVFNKVKPAEHIQEVLQYIKSI